MSQNRVLIILVIVLVVVFIVGVGCGSTGGNNNGVQGVKIDDIKNGFFGTLNKVLVNSQHLTAEDVQVSGPSSSCLQGSTLVINQGSVCNYVISKRGGANVRAIIFNPITGTAELTLFPAGAMKGTLDVPNPSNKNLDVYEQGGSLTVFCVTGVAGKCSLKLG
jgi:hypothetical protein